MEKVKYQPEEIDRMIDEEISRIEVANNMATHASMHPRQSAPPSAFHRFVSFAINAPANIYKLFCKDS